MRVICGAWFAWVWCLHIGVKWDGADGLWCYMVQWMVDCVLEHMKDNWLKKKVKKRKSGFKKGKGKRKIWKNWGNLFLKKTGRELDSYVGI